MFLYIGTINSISRFGGWAHNEWLRAMIWHHEYLIGFYLGFIETRHFSMFPGPKFTFFYNVYTRYELQQLSSMWCDTVEEEQMKHLQHTKEQIEYLGINAEYDFVKKRALVNFLTNEKKNLEIHFHDRAVSMLKNVKMFETTNMNNNLKSITTGSIEAVNQAINDPAQREAILRGSFLSALAGIRSGVMHYENDPLMPILTKEMEARTTRFLNLTPEEESEMLQLTPDQRKIVANQDKNSKKDYLNSVPAIANAGVKGHQKYKDYIAHHSTKH